MSLPAALNGALVQMLIDGRQGQFPMTECLKQAWEWLAMKKTENILQGGNPRKIKIQIDPFGAFWCILFNYKNGLRRQNKTEIS